MDDDGILRVQARIKRVSIDAQHAELVLTAEVDDDLFMLAQAAGRECAIAVQLVPEPAV